MLLSGKASAQTDDVDIASFALTLEYWTPASSMVMPLAWSRTSRTMRRIT